MNALSRIRSARIRARTASGCVAPRPRRRRPRPREMRARTASRPVRTAMDRSRGRARAGAPIRCDRRRATGARRSACPRSCRRGRRHARPRDRALARCARATYRAQERGDRDGFDLVTRAAREVHRCGRDVAIRAGERLAPHSSIRPCGRRERRIGARGDAGSKLSSNHSTSWRRDTRKHQSSESSSWGCGTSSSRLVSSVSRSSSWSPSVTTG